jgi:hypothetical protein
MLGLLSGMRLRNFSQYTFILSHFVNILHDLQRPHDVGGERGDTLVSAMLRMDELPNSISPQKFPEAYSGPRWYGRQAW